MPPGIGLQRLPFLPLCLIGLAPTAALAQGADFQRSYIEPFPSGDRYRVLVLGDSLADGLWSGLYRAFQEDANMEVINKSKPSKRLRARSTATTGASRSTTSSRMRPTRSPW